MVLRQATLIAALTIAASAPVLAQDPHRFEVFGGFAHQRKDMDTNRNGWVASHTTYVRPWIGVEVELSGLNSSYDPLPPPAQNHRALTGLDDNLQTYLVGPRFRLARERFSLGAHTLIGLAQHRFQLPGYFHLEELPVAIPIGIWNNQFGGVAGGSLDIHFSKRFSWRIQPDLLYQRQAGRDTSFRLTTGVVFRFGR